MVGTCAALGGQRENAAAGKGGQAVGEVFMHGQAGEFVIVQPGAFHFARIERETERFDQVQIRTGIGAQPDDVARIGRDFRLV